MHACVYVCTDDNTDARAHTHEHACGEKIYEYSKGFNTEAPSAGTGSLSFYRFAVFVDFLGFRSVVQRPWQMYGVVPVPVFL